MCGRCASTIRTLLLVLIASVALGVSLQAQTGDRADASQGGSAAPATDDHAAAATADGQAMMAEMRASVRKLDELVAKMNTASGEAKVDHIAAIINEFVAQHNGMMSRMMSMQGGDMMQQIRVSSPSPDSATTTKSEKPDADTADHSQHHPAEK